MITKEQIKAEMIVHVALNTHKEPKSVLAINSDESIKSQLAQYEVETTYADEFNVEGSYDVILYNSDMIDEIVLASMQRVLEPKCGIFVSLVDNYEDNSEKMTAQLKTIAEQFWIAMPYRFEGMSAILASKKYHPQADIILDRSDFVDTQYYYTELQNACFVMPAYAQKALTGIARR